MATAQVARPVQASRRRDAARPSVSSKRPATTEPPNGSAAKKRKLDEPHVRTSEYILRKHKAKAPSLVIHLHTNYFNLVGQEGSFAYDSPMKVILEHVRQQTVPHAVLEDLHLMGVQFYDGCLIVEIHNHRGRERKAEGAKGKSDESYKFSMHNYNEHVTPSPYAPYPSRAAEAETATAKETEMPAPERPQSTSKHQEGPHISTIVLHPTQQTQHEELMLIARTPASELRGKKKGSDAQPSTSVPPTPGGSRANNGQPEKLALNQSELYSFQAEALLATEPPLFLDPAGNFEDSQAILDLLEHPLHSGKPPSPTERKKTTAEMAADDAQAAEAERRMLIMDERVKPLARTAAGVASSENLSAASSLGFSRFKTIEMVRSKHEENERQKKEEEARLAVEKRLFEEQAQQQQKQIQAQKQREVYQQQQQLKQRQLAAQQQAEMLRQQQIQHQQAQANMMQAHGHPGQNNMMHNNQQGNFQHTQTAGSPVNRQQTQTPIMNSSPIVQQGAFPMVQNPSQGAAGSPAMPTSAAMQHPHVAMARQASQQNGSRNNTPQMTHTPSMANTMPNRQLSQTPRLQPNSPAVNLPQNTPNMMMQTPNPMLQNTNNFTPEQLIMLNNQRQIQAQQQQLHAQHAQNQHNLSQSQQSHQAPQDIQLSQRMAQLNNARQQLNQAYRTAEAQGDHEQVILLRNRMHGLQQQHNQIRMAQANAQQQRLAATGGNPNMMAPSQSQQSHQMSQQQTPTPGQMHHAHPGQMAPQQQLTPHLPQQLDPQQHAQARALMQQQRAQTQRAFQSLNQLARQNGGGIPHTMVPSLPALLQQYYPQWRKVQQQNLIAQQQRLQGQGQGQGQGQDQQMYLQALQMQRSQIAQQMGGQSGMGGQGGMSGQGGMGGQGVGGQVGMQGYGQQQQQQQQQSTLDASFAAMTNALGRPGTGQGMQ